MKYTPVSEFYERSRPKLCLYVWVVMESEKELNVVTDEVSPFSDF